MQSRFHRGTRIEYERKERDRYIQWKKAAVFDSFFAGIDEPDKLLEEAKALFKRMDTDDSKEIDMPELLQTFPQLDEETAGLLVAEADSDGNGCISFQEMWAVIEEVANYCNSSSNSRRTVEEKDSTLSVHGLGH